MRARDARIARAPWRWWRWLWLWLCAASTPRGAEAYGTLAPLPAAPPPPSGSSERRLSGATFTSDITLTGVNWPGEIGWELNCDDGVHHVGYNGRDPDGGIDADASRSAFPGSRLPGANQAATEVWLEGVVFRQDATCTLDLYDDFGDGWQGTELTFPGLPMPRAFKMIECTDGVGRIGDCPDNKYHGPERIVFSVATTTTYTSTIEVKGGDQYWIVGWELSCNDGLRRVAFADTEPYGGYLHDGGVEWQGRAIGTPMRFVDSPRGAPYTEHGVVFTEGAVCTLDMYTTWYDTEDGHGWNWGSGEWVWTASGLPGAPKSYTVGAGVAPLWDPATGRDGLAPGPWYRTVTFEVAPASPPGAPPVPPEAPPMPPQPQLPGFQYQLGSAITEFRTDANDPLTGMWGLALSKDGTVMALQMNWRHGVSRVYGYSEGIGDWVQRGQDIWGQYFVENRHDSHPSPGSTVALNADGTIVAIGAKQHHAHTQGRVRVYQLRQQWSVNAGFSDAWVQMGQDILSECPTGCAHKEYFGWTVDLSSDGSPTQQEQ